ncbi:competence protein ComEA, partial [Aliarcobacter cryaerophilus]
MKKFVAILAIFTALFLGAIDLQTASKSELMQIKGVGDKKADAIIEYRKTNTINSAEDLKNIKGFGDTIIDNVKKDIK